MKQIISCAITIEPGLCSLEAATNESMHCSYWKPCVLRTFLVAQMLKHLPAMQETWVQSLGLEDLLEKEMATHSSILAWKIPWTEWATVHGVVESDTTEQHHFQCALSLCSTKREDTTMRSLLTAPREKLEQQQRHSTAKNKINK